MRRLTKAILGSTLQNARVLLGSAKIRSSSSQRSLLKNLGSWLGQARWLLPNLYTPGPATSPRLVRRAQITLARNRALLMRDIDIKELICDAFERGLLIAVVPFVAKIIESCAQARDAARFTQLSGRFTRQNTYYWRALLPPQP